MQQHFNARSAFNDMVVGENVALLINNHPRAKAAFQMLTRGISISKKVAEQGIVKQWTGPLGDNLGGVDVDHRGCSGLYGLCIGNGTRAQAGCWPTGDSGALF